MFIDPVRRKRLTPSGVICQLRIGTLHSWRSAAPCGSPGYNHRTPGGVRLLVARLAITIALLAECGSLRLAWL